MACWAARHDGDAGMNDVTMHSRALGGDFHGHDKEIDCVQKRACQSGASERQNGVGREVERSPAMLAADTRKPQDVHHRECWPDIVPAALWQTGFETMSERDNATQQRGHHKLKASLLASAQLSQCFWCPKVVGVVDVRRNATLQSVMTGADGRTVLEAVCHMCWRRRVIYQEACFADRSPTCFGSRPAHCCSSGS